MAGDGPAKLRSREFSGRQTEGRRDVMAQDLGNAAQQCAIFRLLPQRFQGLAGLNLRWHNRRRLRAGQQPGDTADQRHQQDSEDYNPQTVLLPKGGRQLGMGRAKGRDVIGRDWVGGAERQREREQGQGCE
jgi:hypothetical protein